MNISVPSLRWWRSAQPAVRGATFVFVIVLILVLLAFKTQIVATFRGGKTIQAEFSTDYNLRSDRTKVKVAGLQVGVVTTIEHTSRGTTIAFMKVDGNALDTLGPRPEAKIDPLTILGGAVSVNLVPGGGSGSYDGSPIPLNRTTVPTELDHILEALPKDTRSALQGTLRNSAEAFDAGAGESLRKLASQSTKPFADSGKVFKALNGGEGSASLEQLVADVHDLSSTLSTRTTKVGESVQDLSRLLQSLAETRGSLDSTIQTLPSALSRARIAMDSLNGSLDRLGTTSVRLRPTADAAVPLVNALGPALDQLGPLLSDLAPTLRDAQPLVQNLVPTVHQATTVLQDVRGPVLDRVNGPILTMLGNPWHGTGPYANNGGGVQADHKFYEEIGYMVTNLDRASMVQDSQGSLLNFAVGVGIGSVSPMPLEVVLEHLAAQLLGGPK